MQMVSTAQAAADTNTLNSKAHGWISSGFMG
jgi:hypothetical protein